MVRFAQPAMAFCMCRDPKAFTLIELLVTLAVIAVLAALLLPALTRAKQSALRASCLSQLRQQGIAWQIHLDNHQGRFPDRRSRKLTLPGGYRPWSSWPASDPRAGWAAEVLGTELPSTRLWSCPGLRPPLADADQCVQPGGSEVGAASVRYWMWRFDRPDDPVPLDNFWGRTAEGCVRALREAATPYIGIPSGPAEVELIVDVYFPNTLSSVPAELKGRTAHAGGRNRAMLDGHVAFLNDPRTPTE